MACALRLILTIIKIFDAVCAQIVDSDVRKRRLLCHLHENLSGVKYSWF